MRAPAELPYVLMSFRAPALRDPEQDWEPYALEMLANVLDGNEAARLNRTLVREKRAASSAGASYDGVNRGPGMFLLSGTPELGWEMNGETFPDVTVPALDLGPLGLGNSCIQQSESVALERHGL